MVALDIVLMIVVILLIVGGLAWAIVRDRRSKRTVGGTVSPSERPLTENLVMPQELHRQRTMHLGRRGRSRSTSV